MTDHESDTKAAEFSQTSPLDDPDRETTASTADLRSLRGIRWLLLAGGLVTAVSLFRLVESQWDVMPVAAQYLAVVLGALGLYGTGELTYRRLHLPLAGSALMLLFTALVPVPRARARAIRYGVDPSLVLARAVAERTGITVVPALAAPLWWRRHAGRDRSHRGTVRFLRRRSVGPGSVLVDDVLTTGATMLAAHSALQGLPTLVLTATAAGRVRGGEGRSAMEAM